MIRRKNSIAFFALCCTVFVCACLLYRFPIAAVLYPELLCALIGAVFIAVDFVRVRKNYLQLCKTAEMTAAMINDFPKADGIEAEAYQTVIKALQAETAELEACADERYRNMIDYYTLWVHQIKTPIASMRLTLQNEDSAFSRKLLSDLLRIEQYVEMVLVFLRLDSTSSDYVFKEHRVDAIVRSAVKKFAAEFIGRKIRLEYEPIEQTVITDDKWLSFVVEQVLSNALKYTREGSVKIYMQTPKTLCIKDTGIGIAAEDLPRIFEKGYTGYNGRGDAKSSGIGLYLCKRICENLGAEIKAESQPDRGTLILINLEQYKLKKE